MNKPKFPIGTRVRYKKVNPIYEGKTDDRVFEVHSIFNDCGFRYNLTYDGRVFEHRAFEKELERVFKYTFFEGFDYLNNCKIYRVEGIDNEYVGEWSKNKMDIIEELRGLTVGNYPTTS